MTRGQGDWLNLTLYETCIRYNPPACAGALCPHGLSGEKEINLWRIGRDGYWPYVARRGPFDRPNWHWQLGLGSSSVIGKVIPPGNQTSSMTAINMNVQSRSPRCGFHMLTWSPG